MTTSKVLHVIRAWKRRRSRRARSENWGLKVFITTTTTSAMKKTFSSIPQSSRFPILSLLGNLKRLQITPDHKPKENYSQVAKHLSSSILHLTLVDRNPELFNLRYPVFVSETGETGCEINMNSMQNRILK